MDNSTHSSDPCVLFWYLDTRKNSMADRYRAPLDDIRFVLDKMIKFDQLTKIDAFKATTPDLVNQVLQTAAKFAEEVVAPLN